jgi:hypothetical protein
MSGLNRSIDPSMSLPSATAGPAGSASQLQQGPLVIGQEVAMVGYPLAADQALGTKTQPTTLPVVCHGQVVAVSPTNELVAADYGSGELCNAFASFKMMVINGWQHNNCCWACHVHNRDACHVCICLFTILS